MIIRQLGIAVVTILLFTVITGVFYPLLVTGGAQLIFPGRANGSLIERNGKSVGSELIGQPFRDPRYFWSRPSATSPTEYNAAASTGSNFGPLNSALFEMTTKRIKELRAQDSQNTAPVPVDLVTASGSGLDPHISVAAALYQVERVARARQMPPAQVRSLVERETEGRQLGFLGEPRVNVLKLNLVLDATRPIQEGK
jgi:K+-transporting ATPase ATPase C chain